MKSAVSQIHRPFPRRLFFDRGRIDAAGCSPHREVGDWSRNFSGDTKLKSWQTDFLDALLSPGDAAGTFARIGREASLLGFEFCVHGMRLPVPVTRPRTSLFTNYPAEWEQLYLERGYIDVDPTVLHGMRSSKPLIWNDELFHNTRELWEEAQSFGVRYGWAQSQRDPEGNYSLLVLARSEDDLEEAELQHMAPRMQWLAHTSHLAMKSCNDDAAEVVRESIELSEREINVLRWTAEGKTSSEIADILKISERTVNFHVNNAVTKLGACNKTSAAVRAAILGLIW